MPSPSESTTLHATQRAFAAAVLGGPPAAAPLLKLLDGAEDTNLRRLAAYHRNIVGNWIGALRSTCPAAAALLADDFEPLARDYALAHDSPSGDLNEYGADFADWLANTPAAAARPWLPDLIRLEQALQDAYYAADAEPLDFARLSTVPAARHGELCFTLAPAFRQLESRWPLVALWHAGHTGPAATAGASEPGAPATDAGQPEMTEQPAPVWAVRPLTRVWPETATPAEAAFAGALARGATLSAAIHAAFRAPDAGTDEPPFDVGAALARLASLGILTDFNLPGEPS